MNNEQQELLDEAYENYVNKCNEDKWMKEIILDLPFSNKSYGLYSQEEFINKCKTDPEFSERWGLKIDERELSLEERYDLIEKDKYTQFVKWQDYGTDRIKEVLDEKNVPTKLITITRELSLEERAKWLQDNKGYDLLVGNLDHDHIREVVEKESPTNKTIESYE